MKSMNEGEADKDKGVGGQVRARETSSAWRQTGKACD